MAHFRFTPLPALFLALTLPLAALAQDAAAPATDTPPATDAAPDAAEDGAAKEPGAGFNPGVEVKDENSPGSTYALDGDYGDWQVRCVHTEDGFDPCQLYQLLHDQKDNPVAEFTMVALPEGAEAAAGATVVTPLETLLTQQLTMAVDGAKAKRYPFTWCSQIGCFARIGFTQAELDQLKRGIKATIQIVPMVAPDQKVRLTVSLKGFTSGYEKMKAQNAATQARADAAKAAKDAEDAKTPPADK
jgi:invasion protein IalB